MSRAISSGEPAPAPPSDALEIALPEAASSPIPEVAEIIEENQPPQDPRASVREALIRVASLLAIEDLPAPAPASASYGAGRLRNSYVALLGFPTVECAELRSALETQGAVAAAILPSATNLSLVCQVFDLVVWAVPEESARPAPDQVEELRMRQKPTLWVGPRQWVAPLTFPQPGIWDYVETLHPIAPALWRAGMLLGLNQGRNGSLSRSRRSVPETVLVLDDDPISRALIERTLAAAGLVSLAPPEERDAMDYIRQNRPSVVVLELKTSTEQGFELLQLIRQDSALVATRVLMLSAQRGEADVVRAFGLGADDFVAKPFSPLELAARVTRLARPV